MNYIFTTETLAIGMALDELVLLAHSCIILIDNLSVLSALQSVT